MANDYGYFGSGSTGYAHYKQAFDRNFGGSSGGGGGGRRPPQRNNGNNNGGGDNSDSYRSGCYCCVYCSSEYVKRSGCGIIGIHVIFMVKR